MGLVLMVMGSVLILIGLVLGLASCGYEPRPGHPGIPGGLTAGAILFVGGWILIALGELIDLTRKHDRRAELESEDRNRRREAADGDR